MMLWEVKTVRKRILKAEFGDFDASEASDSDLDE
jgi:hypothetical protein